MTIRDGADVIIEIIESTYPMTMEKLFSRKLVSGARKVGDCFTQGSRKGRNQDNFERASLTADQTAKATMPLPKL